MAEAPHCPSCTCGCTCGYGGAHEPENPRCDLYVEAGDERTCKRTPDGWCATHSTGAGPVYCATKEARDE